MSFDVYFECDHCGECPHETLNATYNVSPFFVWCIKVGDEEGLRALDGLTGDEATPPLQAAIEKAVAAGGLSKWDASNRWGTGESALLFVRQLVQVAREWPKLRIRVR